MLTCADSGVQSFVILGGGESSGTEVIGPLRFGRKNLSEYGLLGWNWTRWSERLGYNCICNSGDYRNEDGGAVFQNRGCDRI